MSDQISTVCTGCKAVCETPRRAVYLTFRRLKRRVPWFAVCPCGTKTPIDTSEIPAPGEAVD